MVNRLNILVRNPERKTPLGWLQYRWEYNTQIGAGDRVHVDWIQLIHQITVELVISKISWSWKTLIKNSTNVFLLEGESLRWVLCYTASGACKTLCILGLSTWQKGVFSQLPAFSAVYGAHSQSGWGGEEKGLCPCQASNPGHPSHSQSLLLTELS
jgi:hypothetical protein